MKRRIPRLSPELGLFALIVAAFLFGGSARGDISSVILLRPFAIVLLAYSLTTLSGEVWRDNRAVIGVSIAWAALAAIHLVPLPPAIWQALPGRELATAIDAATRVESWRPISLVPWRTLNALFALSVPLAGLLLALQTPWRRLERIIFLLLGLVLASAFLGLLQVIGGADNPFYTYRITNTGSAVGLFANRNHNAIFLSLGFPLIAASLALYPGSAEHVKTREWAGAGAGLLLIPFILTTQSRAGILVGAICIAAALWVYRSPIAQSQKRRPRRQIDPRLVFGILAAAGVMMLTVLFSTTNAVARLSRLGQGDDELRLQIWPPIVSMIGEYMPFGSGIGTFVEIFQVHEPDALLRPSYINHAHNDWLEILLEGGIPAAAIVIVAILVVGRRAAPVVKSNNSLRDTVLRRLGVTVCVVLAVSSLYDYPVRTPAGALLLAIGVALAAGRWPRSEAG